jgi:Tol biopolymer transport system component
LGRDHSGPSWGDYAPKWSPDGKRIVFESTRNDPKGQLYSIYVMNDNGSGLRELAGTDAELPSWSPDGEHIVYVQGQLNYDQYDEAVYGGGGRIMVMEADGSGKRELAFSGSTDAVRWSPDAVGSHTRRIVMIQPSTHAPLFSSSISTAAGSG